jgi:hypothetical protein
MIIFSLCRLVFYAINTEFFPDITTAGFVSIFAGGLRFDLTAMIYTNLVFAAMMILPFRFRYNIIYQTIAKWIFIVFNSVAVLLNCIDMVYFKFSQRRTTMSVFSEFQNEDNLAKIFLDGIVNYWFVSLFFILCILLFIKFYRSANFAQYVNNKGGNIRYYVKNTIALCLTVMLIVFGARGGVGDFVRPITLSNANQYVEKPLEAAIVLNTPFCMFRTIGKRPFKNPHFFKTEQELAAVYEPIIKPQPKGEFRPMNVVIFIMESFSKEFVGELNKELDGGKYKGYTPFLDSLIRKGLTFEYTFANGHKSIDAMPSILSSIPRFYEPYFLTSYSNNKVSGIAGELGKKDYYTAFFHGAPNGSMGFEAFARVSGFKDYFGKNEYNNNADYDGTWAIWDEEFFQFFANKMGEFNQPFITTMFSASSHHPFKIPARYTEHFKESGIHPLHKVIEYSDNALRLFFENAKQQSWYKNTLFVITADHTNALSRPEYLNDAGRFEVPIVFFHPSDSSLRGRIKDIASQVDIMPTVLGYLNYDKPFVAFGHNLLDDAYKNRYAINCNSETFQFFTDSTMLQFEGKNTKAIYDFVHDISLKHNLKSSFSSEKRVEIETLVKAIVQQYMERMLENRLSYEEK